MTITLISIDFLIYTFTSYSSHFVVLAIPFLKSFYPIAIYFTLLSVYDYRYLWNLIVLFLLHKIDEYLNSMLRDTTSLAIIKIGLYYAIYFLLLGIFRRLF